MKKLLLTLSVCGLALCAAAQMGKRFPSEKQVVLDQVTGVPMTILTSTDKNDRFLYQTHPMWTADGKYIVFRSSSRTDDKTGQMYFIEQASGVIIQATEGTGIDSGVSLSRKENKMFFLRKVEGISTMMVINLDSLFKDSKAGTMKERAYYEKTIGKMPADFSGAGGFGVDVNDDFAYIGINRPNDQVKVKLDDSSWSIKQRCGGIVKMDLKTGKVSKVIDSDFTMGHVQANPFVAGEIIYCMETGGDATQRMWVCTADGKVNRALYPETPDEWITHETVADADHVYFNIIGHQDRLRTHPTGIGSVNLRTGEMRLLGQVQGEGKSFWHCNGSQDGQWAVGDDFAGNISLVNCKTSEVKLLTTGHQMKPDHAHPYFGKDPRKILFQSGKFTNGERLNLVLVTIPDYFY